MNTSVLGSTGGATLGMVLGAVVLVMLADVAPRIVIGLLVLILVGLVLAHSSAYVGLLQKLNPSPGGGGGGKTGFS